MFRIVVCATVVIGICPTLSAEPGPPAVSNSAARPAAIATSPAQDATASSTPDKPVSRADRIRGFRQIVRKEAEDAKIPFDLVDAVLKVESDYDPTRIGDVGEIGLMQVRPGTAAMLGFTGPVSALADPETNIHYGTLYLAGAWRLSKGNVCRALMKYRAGHGQDGMSARSVTYCMRAKTYLTSLSSPLAATITPADLVATILTPASPRAIAAAALTDRVRPGPGFWTRWQAHIKKANARVEAKWRQADR